MVANQEDGHMAAMTLIREYLDGPLTEPHEGRTKEEKKAARLEDARRYKALLREMTLNLMCPAAAPKLAEWRKGAKNAYGFSVSRNGPTDDYRTLLPELEKAAREANSKNPRTAKRAAQTKDRLFGVMTINELRWSEMRRSLSKVRDELREVQAEFDESGADESLLACAQASWPQQNLLVLLAAQDKYHIIEKAARIRARAGMPLGEIDSALALAETQHKEYVALRRRFLDRNARGLATVLHNLLRPLDEDLSYLGFPIMAHKDEMMAQVIAECTMALDFYDPSEELSLMTYFQGRVRGVVFSFIGNLLNCAHVDPDTLKKQVRYRRIMSEHRRAEREENKPIPSDEAIAAELRISVKRLRVIRNVQESVSLESPIGDDEDGQRFGDTLASSTPSPEEAIAAAQIPERLDAIYRRVLTDRERRILLALQSRYTKKQIAKMLHDENGKGLTVRRISGIEDEAWIKLLADSEFCSLKSYLSTDNGLTDKEYDWLAKMRVAPRWFAAFMDGFITDFTRGTWPTAQEPAHANDDAEACGYEAWPHQDEEDVWDAIQAAGPVCVRLDTQREDTGHRSVPFNRPFFDTEAEVESQNQASVPRNIEHLAVRRAACAA